MGRVSRVHREQRLGRAPDRVSHAPRQDVARALPTAIDAQRILSLQGLAGNRATQHVVRSLQRDPLSASADPHGYTGAAGAKDVRGSGMTRVEVHGLTMGLSSGFAGSYTTKSGTYSSDETNKTAEGPEHMAVVVMPDHIAEGTALQVIVQFHGFGFRGGDPYAGYLVAKGDKNVAAGSVRDVDQEHWEQQLGAVNSGRTKGQPLVLAILAQGRGPDAFGNTATSAFVQDVLGKVPALSKITDIEIVLSAHSGGGYRISERIDQVKTADKAQVPAAKPGRAPEHATNLVVMFDAEAIGSVAGAATKTIKALAETLKGADAIKAREAIAAPPKFRFYFHLDGSYHKPYVAEWDDVQAALTRVPAAWRQGGSEVTVDDLVRFVAVYGKGVDHEHVISGGKPINETAQTEKQGSLADALRASLDPRSDRDKAFDKSRLPEYRRVAAEAHDPVAKAKKAEKKATKSAGAAPRRGPVHLRSPSRPTPRTTVSTPAGTTGTAATPKVAGGWRGAGMVADYTYTERHKQVIASQTKEERATDRASYDKEARTRLSSLAKKEKRGSITDAEKAELTTLRGLSDRVAAAQSALKHKDVEEVLAAAGSNVAAWYGALQTGRFLNQPVHVHPALAARLTRAESALVADSKVNPRKLNAADLGTTLIHSVADMRVPKSATGGTSLSMHVFGLAVDLNYKENPFVGSASKGVFGVVMRATSLVDGTAIDIRPKLGTAGSAFDILSAASRALSTYLSFAGSEDKTLSDLVRDHTPRKGEPIDLAGWVKQIEKDRTSLAGGDFANHTAASQGFMDLDKALVLTMEDVGLTWGGTYGGGKDIMHFDLREGDGAAIDKARNAHAAST